MQMLPLEKSHSSPGSSKSSSDGQLRSHGPSRSQSKSSVTQAHLEDAGIAIAAAEAAVQQSRLQPSKSRPYPWYTSCDMLPFSCACKLCWDRCWDRCEFTSLTCHLCPLLSSSYFCSLRAKWFCLVNNPSLTSPSSEWGNSYSVSH